MKMDLTIIMVNYKCDKNKLNSCLKSINIKAKVLIVDHSHDLKQDQINIPNNISLEIIKNKNLGNGAGINYGIENAKTKYTHNPPRSKESLYFREIFNKHYPERDGLIPYYWLPKWSGDTVEPSARTLNVYKD